MHSAESPPRRLGKGSALGPQLGLLPGVQTDVASAGSLDRQDRPWTMVSVLELGHRSTTGSTVRSDFGDVLLRTQKGMALPRFLGKYRTDGKTMTK